MWRLPAPTASKPKPALKTIATFSSFPNPTAAGFHPGVPIADHALDLYDFNSYTVSNNQILDLGTVFRVRPPTASHTGWQTDILYAFQGKGDGGSPTALVEAPDGRLYGVSHCIFGENVQTACSPSYADTLFRLTPRDIGGHQLPWNFEILHIFDGPSGRTPQTLIKTTLADGRFALIGETVAGGSGYLGVIFEYIP